MVFLTLAILISNLPFDNIILQEIYYFHNLRIQTLQSLQVTMSPQEKIDYIKKAINEKAQISPAGSFCIDLTPVADLEATGGFPDEAPILLSSSEQWLIIQKFQEEGYIKNVQLDGNTVWLDLSKRKTRRSNILSYIKTTDELLQHRGLFSKFIQIIGGIENINATYYYKMPTDESNDDLIQLLIDLEIIDYDWDDIQKQTHRQVGNRIIEYGFRGEKVLELHGRIAGKNGSIKREALELISKEIGNRYTFNKIVRIFTDLGVPESMFIADTKWRAVFYILSYYSTSPSNENRKFVLKIIEEVLHPLMFDGDEQRANEVQQNYRSWLKYDRIVIDKNGKVYQTPIEGSASEMDKAKKSDISFEQSLFLLKICYSKILEICDAFAGNYLAVRNSAMNHYYTILGSMIDEILDRDGFDELRNEKPHLFESLIGDIEDFDIEWEYESKPAYNFLAKIEKLFILSGSPTFKLPPEIEKFLQTAGEVAIAHKKYCHDLWQKQLKNIDTYKQSNDLQSQHNNTQEVTKEQAPAAPLQVQIVGGSIGIEGLEEKIGNLLQSKNAEGNRFPYKLPAGTKWEDFIIKFESDEAIFIQVKQWKYTADYKELGMVGKGKNPKPGAAWVFLKVLASQNGELSIKDAAARDRYKKQKELLAKSLQAYFSIDYDPFFPYRSSSEKNGNSYKIKCTLIPFDDDKKVDCSAEDDELGIKEYLADEAPLKNER